MRKLIFHSDNIYVLCVFISSFHAILLIVLALSLSRYFLIKNYYNGLPYILQVHCASIIEN